VLEELLMQDNNIHNRNSIDLDRAKAAEEAGAEW
jgi:hypothetical protein